MATVSYLFPVEYLCYAVKGFGNLFPYVSMEAWRSY